MLVRFETAQAVAKCDSVSVYESVIVCGELASKLPGVIVEVTGALSFGAGVAAAIFLATIL